MRDTRYWHPFADMGSVRGAEFVIERGEDVWVWDAEGRRYLDATASLWYANVGHGRPEIAAAVAKQLSRIEAYSNFGDFATAPTLELVEVLADRAPMPARVFLTSGGGDSIDAAAKLARRYWYELGQPERTVLVSRSQGYHGTHGYGTAIGGIAANRTGYGPQVESEQVAHDSVEALEQAIARVGAERIAAFFVEPVIGAGGLYPPCHRYIEGVAAICARKGVLLVVDAVICGFGRLGTWFGIERGRGAGDDRVREGGHERLPAAGRGDRFGPSRRAVLARAGGPGVSARAHIRRARDVLRRRAGEIELLGDKLSSAAVRSKALFESLTDSPITRRRARSGAASGCWPRSSSRQRAASRNRAHSAGLTGPRGRPGCCSASSARAVAVSPPLTATDRTLRADRRRDRLRARRGRGGLGETAHVPRQRR